MPIPDIETFDEIGAYVLDDTNGLKSVDVEKYNAIQVKQSCTITIDSEFNLDCKAGDVVNLAGVRVIFIPNTVDYYLIPRQGNFFLSRSNDFESPYGVESVETLFAVDFESMQPGAFDSLQMPGMDPPEITTEGLFIDDAAAYPGYPITPSDTYYVKLLANNQYGIHIKGYDAAGIGIMTFAAIYYPDSSEKMVKIKSSNANVAYLAFCGVSGSSGALKYLTIEKVI